MKLALRAQASRSQSTPAKSAPNTLDTEDYEKSGWLGPNLLICHYIPASDSDAAAWRAPKRR